MGSHYAEQREADVKASEPTKDPIENIERDWNYASLLSILMEAYEQASGGKGAERHAQSTSFDDQPMQRICDMVGVGFAEGQAIKKIQEQTRFDDVERQVAELLGAINYIAGAIIHKRKAQHSG